MKLMLLNLPRSFSENDMAKMVKRYGNIKGCELMMDAHTGTSKGFGFVDMALQHEAVIAIKELNGTMIGSNKIRVKAAE